MKNAMDLLDDEPAATPAEAPSDDNAGSLDSQVSTAISGTAAGAKLTPDELKEVVSAVMAVVNGEEKDEPTPAADNGDMDELENLVTKKPHPLGKEFEG